MPWWHAESKKRRMARKLISFNNRGEAYAVLIERAQQAGDKDEASWLLRGAKLSLPDEELPKVRQAAVTAEKVGVGGDNEEAKD